MISRFCKLVLLSLLAIPVLAQTVPPGATPVPTPTPAPKPKEGYIRLWNMIPAGGDELSVVHDTGGAGEALASSTPCNYSAGYVPVKPGRYALKLVRTAAPDVAIKTFDVVMRADVYVTFLAQKKGDEISVEMLDDTYDRTKALAGRLTIRHFLPGTKVTVTPAGQRATGQLTDGTVEVLEELPLRPILFRMRATLPGGGIRDWTTEVDFRVCRRASLLLGLDPYGRFRPRVSPDGQFELKGAD